MAKLQSKNLNGVKLTELQEKVLSYLVSKAEKEHSFLVDVDRSDIVSELNIKGTGTISKVFCRLEDLGLIKALGGNSYKLSNTFFMFVENKDIAFTTAKIDVSAEAEAFLPIASWLQSDTIENYCVAYRTLKDSKSVFTDKEKLAAKEFLADKVNKYGVAPVVDKINVNCNKCELTELILLIS